MAIRGERIGTAYVRILADGSGLSDSVRDELKDSNSEEVFKQQGRTDSEAYHEGREEQMDRFNKEFVKGLVAGIRRNAGRMDAAVHQLNDGWFTDLENQLRTRFPKIGEQMVANLREGFLRSGGDDQFLERFVENLEAEAMKATKEFDNLVEIRRAAEEKMNKDHDRALKEDMQRTVDWMNKLNLAYQMNDKFNLDRMTEFHTEALRINKQFDNEVRKIQEEGRRQEHANALNRTHDINMVRLAYRDLIASIRISEEGGFLNKTDSNFTRRIAELRQSIANIGGDKTMSAELLRIEKRLGSLPPKVLAFNRGLSRTADLLGGATGRGSRNNFLNFIGSMTRGFANLVFLIPKVTASIGGEFYSAFRRAGGGMSGLLAGVGSLAPMAAQLAAGLTAVAAAAAVLFVVMSPLISLFSALLGIVAALAASIGFALVAAFSALAAIALPAVAAIAVALGGILSMSDKMKKKFSDAFKPVKDAFVDLGDTVAKVFTGALTNQADRFANILEGMDDLVRKIAEAIVDVGNSWLDMMEGPGFQQFINAMERFLPGAIRRLGDIFAQTIGGFGGILRGMIPFMRDVLRYLDDITGRFNDWANSAEGQNSIRDFFDRASDSLASVWGWLDSVWDLLRTVLDAGKDTGDSIFDSMAENIRKFTKYLTDNPDALTDWFSHAKRIATDIGNLAVDIGELIDKLDSPEGRAALHDMLSWLQDVAKITGPVVSGLSDVTGAITAMQDAADESGNGSNAPDASGWAAFFNNPADFFAGGIVEFFKPGGTFEGWIFAMGDQLERAGGWIEEQINAFGTRVKEIWDRQVDKLLPDFLTGGEGGGGSALMTNPFAGLNPQSWFDGINWEGVVAITHADWMEILNIPTPGSIASKFKGVGKSVLSAIGLDSVDLNKIFNYVSPGTIAQHFATLASRVLSAIGVNSVELIKIFKIPSLSDIAGHFADLAAKILNTIGVDSVDLLRAFDFPSLGDIASYFSGLGGMILDAIGTIDVGSLIDIPSSIDLPGPLPRVDISNPLGRVAAGISGGTGVAGGKVINASGWTIVTPTEDPEAVATEVVNQLAAVGY